MNADEKRFRIDEKELHIIPVKATSGFENVDVRVDEMVSRPFIPISPAGLKDQQKILLGHHAGGKQVFLGFAGDVPKALGFHTLDYLPFDFNETHAAHLKKYGGPVQL